MLEFPTHPKEPRDLYVDDMLQRRRHDVRALRGQAFVVPKSCTSLIVAKTCHTRSCTCRHARAVIVPTHVGRLVKEVSAISWVRHQDRCHPVQLGLFRQPLFGGRGSGPSGGGGRLCFRGGAEAVVSVGILLAAAGLRFGARRTMPSALVRRQRQRRPRRRGRRRTTRARTTRTTKRTCTGSRCGMHA